MSALALLMCVSMLIGSTFAWFTDSVTSGRNMIISGNLDVELYYAYPENATTASELNWKKVDADSEIFDDDTLWEPGYTQVVYFKAVNAGSLAFYYDFNVNVIREISGVNQNGESFNLSDFIEVTPIWTPSVEEAVAAGRDYEPPFIVNFFKYTLANPKHVQNGTLEQGESDIFGMYVQMPEDVDNTANHNGKDVPSIRLGIEVLASQAALEPDSFGNDYDKNAWSEVSSNYEIVGNKIMINSAQELAAFAKDVSASNASKFDGMTVEILEDIDLGGRYWNPITLWNNGVGGAGLNLTINGNGKTISNLITHGGESVGFIGSSSANLTVKDLTFENADVECGVKYAGVVMGYQYGKVELKNVKVIDSKVVSTAKYGIGIGGLVGFSVQNDGATLAIDGCEVSRSYIEGYHSIGGFVGITKNSDTAKMSLNNSKSVDNTLVYGSAQQGAYDYGCSLSGYNELAFAGTANEADNFIAKKAASAEEVKNALETTGNIVISEDIKVEDGALVHTQASTKPITIEGNGATIESSASSVDAFQWEGGTIPAMSTIFSSADGSTVTVNDLSFAGTMSALMLGHYQNATYNNYNTVLNNVNVIGAKVVSFSSNTAPAVCVYGTATLNNCNIYGTTLSELDTDPMWPVYDLVAVNYTDLTVNDSKVGSLLMWNQAKVTVADGTEVDTVVVLGNMNTTKYGLTIKAGATVGAIDLSGITNKAKINITIEDGANVGKIIANGVEYATLADWQNA